MFIFCSILSAVFQSADCNHRRSGTRVGASAGAATNQHRFGPCCKKKPPALLLVPGTTFADSAAQNVFECDTSGLERVLARPKLLSATRRSRLHTYRASECKVQLCPVMEFQIGIYLFFSYILAINTSFEYHS